MRWLLLLLLLASCGVARREPGSGGGDGGPDSTDAACEPKAVVGVFGFYGVSDGSHIYYVGDDGTLLGQDSIWRIHRSTLEVEELATLVGHSTHKSQLAVDDSSVYWAYGIDLRGEIGIVDKEGGDMNLVADEEIVPRSPSVNSSRIFWGGAGSIRSYPLAGGPLEDFVPVPSGERVSWVNANDAQILYLDEGRIWSVDVAAPAEPATAIIDSGSPFAVTDSDIWLADYGALGGEEIRAVSRSSGDAVVMAEAADLFAPALGSDGTLLWLEAADVDSEQLHVRRDQEIKRYELPVQGTPLWLHADTDEIWWLDHTEGNDIAGQMYRIRFDEDCG